MVKYLIKNNIYSNKVSSDESDYRFGMGIEVVDNNVLSGPDVERAVNGKPIEDEAEKLGMEEHKEE